MLTHEWNENFLMLHVQQYKITPPPDGPSIERGLKGRPQHNLSYNKKETFEQPRTNLAHVNDGNRSQRGQFLFHLSSFNLFFLYVERCANFDTLISKSRCCWGPPEMWHLAPNSVASIGTAFAQCPSGSSTSDLHSGPGSVHPLHSPSPRIVWMLPWPAKEETTLKTTTTTTSMNPSSFNDGIWKNECQTRSVH